MHNYPDMSNVLNILCDEMQKIVGSINCVELCSMLVCRAGSVLTC